MRFKISTHGLRRDQRDALPVPVTLDDSFVAINWAEVKADLAADDFDNGRSPRWRMQRLPPRRLDRFIP
jgi:hypothetical protein